MKRIAIAMIVAALVWFGGRAVFSAFASDETKIRNGLEAACAGFGGARMNPILEFLARDFVDDTSGFRRDDVRGAVAGLFFSEKDPATRGFPYRAILVPDSLAIDVARPAATVAEVSFVIRIDDVRGGGERTVWEFRVAGSMRKGDDGWQLARSTHQTNAGNWTLK